MGNCCSPNDTPSELQNAKLNEKDVPSEDYAKKIDFDPENFLSAEVKRICAEEPFPVQFDSAGRSHLPDYYQLPDGRIYCGQWKDGKPDGQGKLYIHDGVYYEGSLEKGSPNGYGRKIHQNGDTFMGAYLSGRLKGEGQIIWRNKNEEGIDESEVYKGGLDNNLLDGRGEYKWSDGKVYNGDWKEGKIDGEGTLNYPDGRIYEGSFKDDVKHGKGKLRMNDNTTWVGTWLDGKKEGEFKIHNNTTGDIRVETYRDGKKV